MALFDEEEPVAPRPQEVALKHLEAALQAAKVATAGDKWGEWALGALVRQTLLDWPDPPAGYLAAEMADDCCAWLREIIKGRPDMERHIRRKLGF